MRPYLKEGETPRERMDRDFKDSQALLAMLADERKKREATEIKLQEAQWGRGWAREQIDVAVSAVNAAEARALAAEAAAAGERERVEQLHATIRKAHVAMTMACALPGVAAEYDFSEAIASTEATLARRAAAIRVQGE